MAEETVRVDGGELERFAREVFAAAGLPAEDAATEAEVLVWANLRGIDSHGVLRIEWYLGMIDDGQINPRPALQTLRETPATLYVDADRAFGPVATIPVMRRVMEKARAVGIGWGLIRNVTHQGAMGYYPLMAAEADMIGLAIVCSPPNMAPFGARTAGLHNSPIAIAAPALRHPPLVLDMATSIVAGGKISLAQDRGVPLGAGWALDAEGNPTLDPHLASVLLPAGGPKGSGLALMFQCLTSQLAENPLLAPALAGEPRRHNQNSVVAAIDIGAFAEPEAYKRGLDELIDRLKALPRAAGHDGILMPGEPELRILADRRQNGIPLPPGTLAKMRAAAARFGVDLPGGV